MAIPRSKLISFGFALLLTLSATSAGFLFGRTAKLQQAAAQEQMEQLGEQVVGVGTLLQKGAKVVRRLLVK